MRRNELENNEYKKKGELKKKSIQILREPAQTHSLTKSRYDNDTYIHILTNQCLEI